MAAVVTAIDEAFLPALIALRNSIRRHSPATPLACLTYPWINLDELARRLYARHGTLLSRRVQLPWRERTRAALERLTGQKFTSFAGQPVSRVDRHDGVLLELADGGWVLVRQSGAEKQLRIYAEGASSRHLRMLVSEARRLVRVAEEGV